MAVKRNSNHLEIYRELLVGAKQDLRSDELAYELPAETYSRWGRMSTVTMTGYR